MNYRVCAIYIRGVIQKFAEKCFHFFELSVSFETNSDSAHTFKQNKYAYLLTDVTTLTPNVVPFEVGARGYVTPQNKDRLKLLHKFCKPGLKLKSFVDSVSVLAVNASYFLFISRKDPSWSDPPFLGTPFSTPQ